MISILLTALNLLNTAVLVYCVLSFVMPGSSLMATLRPYADMLLDPFRKLIYRVFPAAADWGMDFSPILLFFVIRLASSLLSAFA